MRFENIAYLNALWVLVPITLLFGYYMYSRRRALQLFGKELLINQLSPNKSTGRHLLKFFLYAFAFVCLVIAWANPQVGTKYERVKREGVDVFIALDVSKSMLAKDVVPARMPKAKQLVSDLIDGLTNDRIGLIVFAGNAYLQMPLTVDYFAGKMYLKNIDANMIPQQGTAIGDAVKLAMNSFNQEEEKHKALVIISDGENHEGDAIDAIEEAADAGVKVFTIGVGSEAGAPIPINKQGDLKKDTDGNTVLTRLNEDMMRKMAAEGNGNYYNISEQSVSERLINAIGSMEGKTLDEKVISDYKDHFPLFLGIAFGLLLLEFLISERSRKLFGKWQL